MSDDREVASPGAIHGQLLRRARLGAGLTYQDAARAAGITPKILALCERGQADLSLPHLELLSRAYGVPLATFWDQKGHATPATPADAPDAYVALRRKMIGVLLRQARLARGGTLGDFVQATGCSPEHLAAIEFGEVDVSFADLTRLAELCELPVAHFADAEAAPEPGKSVALTRALEEMPADVWEFIARPSNVLYVRVAMLLSKLSSDTLRQIGEGLLDITL